MEFDGGPMYFSKSSMHVPWSLVAGPKEFPRRVPGSLKGV